ncbi:ATP-binding cassette transporter-like protein [Aureobasidium melanogenum CBS 110374]|uniref:ATP-binding cassette transporter-like protein n=2 Tax=Aureobasidium melanogenum TaxID=46634 RepID=A0A074VJ07_AURM1|nr:ATP-binding cassette transporter-like protein [Aureobasidium melanogenum CBS 110374]KEQ57572.1 ATP-binding cassette transporter-like protein [Aureobasidium melanogenum CBS 110374]
MTNSDVDELRWTNISVAVTDKNTKQPKLLLRSVSGDLKAGQIMALMGPSGSGKTTLLNVLAGRQATAKCKTEGDILVDRAAILRKTFQKLSSFVEQEHSLIGSLTVAETLDFAARLALPSTITSRDRKDRVLTLLDSFGLSGQRDAFIGSPIQKGISGGQKRRVSVASQLITAPKILFLDEPTSDLDSLASFEVVQFLKTYARKHNLIVIASIHQPSTSTFELFDKVLLLSQGKVCYAASVPGINPYFENLGLPIPVMKNPAEHLLEITNIDFWKDKQAGARLLARIQQAWIDPSVSTTPEPSSAIQAHSGSFESDHRGPGVAEVLRIPVTLLHRLLLKSYRDIVTYWIRLVMYLGLAIIMGTVWLRLKGTQDGIQPFINAIFFGSAFMSFMAVAYVPAFLEDYGTFAKERANGLYGPTAFTIANFLIGLPFYISNQLIIALTFSLITYWLIDFRSGGTAFITYVMWLFLGLVAAESLVTLVSLLSPNFIVALALVAFANGLWMCVNGFLVPTKSLNVFWGYVFHYIDYQAYVFRGMLVNEFSRRNYTCASSLTSQSGCSCSYTSELADHCLIDGKAVLSYYDYSSGQLGETVGHMLAIIAVYRLLGWVVLYLRE